MSLVGAVKAFNKAGARLLSKETNVKLVEKIRNLNGQPFVMGKMPFHGLKPPKEAVSANFVQGENHFGQEGFSIVSFFDENGKLIERSRFNHIGDKVELASHTQYNSQIRVTNVNGSADVISHNKLTDFFKDGKNIQSEDFRAIIDYETNNPVVTRSILTKRKGKGNIWFEQANRDSSVAATPHRTDRYTVNIEQVGKGLQKKSYKANYDFSPNGHFYSDFTGKVEANGLTTDEIKMLRKDKYLPVRLMRNPVERCEHLKKDIFERTGISQKTEVEYYYGKGANVGGISDGGKIHINVGVLNHIDSFIERLAHESRHEWQYDIVQALKQGKINDPKLKKMAEDLKYAFEHKPADYYKHGESYYNCLFEKDAYAWGDTYKERFYKEEAPLYNIFNLSKASYFLG